MEALDRTPPIDPSTPSLCSFGRDDKLEAKKGEDSCAGEVGGSSECRVRHPESGIWKQPICLIVSWRQMRLLTKGNLSSHMTKLEDAGLIKVEKAFFDKIPRTVYELTKEGSRALDAHREAILLALNSG